MIKMIATVCRRPGMTHAEFLHYIETVHGAIARENPVTLRRYVQSHVFDAAFGTALEANHRMTVSRDSVTELFWDSFEAMGQTFAHPHVREKVGPDGRNFADERVSLSLVAAEHEVAVTHAGRGGVKVMHFMRMQPGLSLETYFERWTQAHARALQAVPAAALALRRCVQNRQLPQANAMLAYFGAKDMPIYEGVASLWFDDVAALAVFRDYERALLAVNAQAEFAFYEPADSFFVHATEVEILNAT